MSKWDRILLEVDTFIARRRLMAKCSIVGRGLRVFGQPIIAAPAGAQITLGDRVVLTSKSTATALGVRATIILRCLNSTATIEIDDDTGMSGTAICAAKSVRIGKRCLIGADCMIFDTDFHNLEIEAGGQPRRYSAPRWDEISQPVVIGDDVFLGARVIVGKGVTIGSGTIVAAGSVVSRDLPPGCVAAGVPAKPIRDLAASAE